jgi:DNA-binding NtrC family response regulator
VQAKLLRAIEERAVTPVGATESVPCDVRLLAATNRDLKQAMAAGQFREDLYARLADVLLFLPPLRQRREDVLRLLLHASPGGLPEMPADLIEQLLHYSWPRNVREVYKIADHLRLFGIDDALRARLEVTAEAPAEAPAEAAAAAAPVEPPRPHRVATPTKEQLMALMEKHAGVAEYAARELGCSRRQIGRWLEVYGIDRDRFRSRS